MTCRYYVALEAVSKLALKDEINRVQDYLTPDIIA